MDSLSCPDNRYSCERVHTWSQYLDLLILSGLTEILPPTGLWLFHASLWLPSAEELCSVAPLQWSTCGKGHAETTAPSAGETQEHTLYSILLL